MAKFWSHSFVPACSMFQKIKMYKLSILLLAVASIIVVQVSAFLLPGPSSTSTLKRYQPQQSRALSSTTLSKKSMAAEGAHAEIEVVSNPDQDTLFQMGVADWPTWGCGVSQFPWTYDEAETCYILNGKVVVTPDDGRAAVSVGAGDLCTFPAGMSCTWDVKETISKHYKLH